MIDITIQRLPLSVIASEAKQSIFPHEERVDCFVASLPCANALRLSQAMTGVETNAPAAERLS
jgi:hypothetical protein